MTSPTVKPITRWSLSAMKQFYKCPAQYAYQRFDKLPQPPAPALENGIKVHSLGEAFLKSEITGMPKEYRNFENELKVIRKHGFVPEANWAVTIKWEPCGWTEWGRNWLLGKTDAHKYSKKERHLDIIDFKTGRIYPDHSDGAEVYSCLGAAYYPDVETVSTEFWYLDRGPGEVGESPFTYTRDEIDDHKRKWERKAHRMLNAKKFNPRPTNFGCKFCAFRSDRNLPTADRVRAMRGSSYSRDVESDVETHFVTRSKRHRIWPVKIYPFGERGFPDRLCLGYNARIFFVELKRPGKGKLSARQKLLHRLLRQMGFEVYLLYTKDKVDEFYRESLQS